jgi:hypothetical protein
MLTIKQFPGMSPIVLTRLENPERFEGVGARIDRRDGEWRLHVYAGTSCVWIGSNDEPTGQYRQKPFGHYCRDIGMPIVMVQTDEDVVIEQPGREAVVLDVCRACPEFVGQKGGNTRVECRRSTASCGCVSVHRETCPESKWTGPLRAAGLVAPHDITPETPVPELIRMIDAGYAAWPTGYQSWQNARMAHRLYLDHLDAGPYPEGRFKGRGIVMCGGGRYGCSAYVSIRAIRHAGCQLPVELWSLPGELSEHDVKAFRSLGVVCREASADGGWQLKSAAIMESAFETVLYLDADCYPVLDPTYLLDLGTTFWPDIPQGDIEDDAWRAVGLEPIVEPAVESGQMVIDKRTGYLPLSMACWMNRHSDFWYRIPGSRRRKALLYGDKDTFHLAWRKCEVAYRMPPLRPLWTGHTYQHHDLDGRIVFQHRCRDKFTTEMVKQNLFAETPQQHNQNHFDSRLCLEQFCHAAVFDYEDVGLVTNEKSDFATAASLYGQTFHRVQIGDKAGQDITLLENCRIRGGGQYESTWLVRNGKLTVHSPSGPHRFTKHPDGSWQSRRQGRPVLLLPYRPDHRETFSRIYQRDE